MIDKIIEELEELKEEYEQYAEEHMDDESWGRAKAYEEAIEIVRKYQNLTLSEQIALLPNDLNGETNLIEFELRILDNFINSKSIAYRDKNLNYQVVMDILMQGTSHSGMTSCIKKCRELGIDPYGHDFSKKGNE